MATSNVTLDMILGILIVGVYACDRFNTPSSNRSSTTAASFYIAGGVYLGATLGMYALLLFGFPSLVTSWASEAIKQLGWRWAEDLSAPLLTVLLLTVALPRVPVISGADEWIRKKLWHMAAIPGEVRRLGVVLRRSPFLVSPERQDEIRASLLKEGFHAGDVLFQESTAPQSVWTKVAALMRRLEDWEEDSQFSGFVASFPAELEALKNRYEQLTPKARSCFRLVRDHVATPDAGQGDDLIWQLQADFAEQAKDLLNGLYDFIGRGILQCNLTHGARCKRLGEMGFQVKLPPPTVSMNELVTLFMGLTVLLGAGFIHSSRDALGQTISVGELLGRVVMVAVLYCVAIWWAIYPKERWQCARRDTRDMRPVACYLLSALLASGTGLAINLMVRLMFHPNDVPVALMQFRQGLPWIAMTFVTAFVTACLADNRPGPFLTASWLRWLEGIGQAAVMMGTGYLVHFMLMQTCPRVPPLSMIVLYSGIIGFGIGLLVPSWYRSDPHRRQVEDDHLGSGAMVKTAIP